MQYYKVASRVFLDHCRFAWYFFRRIILLPSSALDNLLLTEIEKEALKLKDWLIIDLELSSVGAFVSVVGAGDEVGLLLTEGESDGAGDTLGALLTVGDCVGIGVGGQRLLQQEHLTPSGGQSKESRKKNK